MQLKWLAVAVVSVSAPACFSSNDSQPGPDAGAPYLDAGPVSDATLPPGPDGSTPEAAPDTYVAETSLPEAAVEAGPRPVTVVVHSVLGPEQGVTVVFQDANGAVIGTGTTDALGSVSQLVPSGSQVTAVMGTTVSPLLTTIQSVSPGDVLAIYDSSNDSSTAQVSVDFGPDSGTPPGTAYLFASIGQCSYGFTSPPPFVMSLSSLYDCQAQGQFPVLLTAQAGADGGYADFAYMYQKGNTVPTDGGVANVTMTGAWSPFTLGTQALVVNNPPASSSLASMSEIASNVGLPTSYTQYMIDDAGAANYVFPTHPGYADSLQAEVLNTSGTYRDDAGYYVLAVSGLAARGPGGQTDAGAAVLDMGQSYPLIDEASVNWSNPAQPAVAWGTDAGALAPADGVFVAVSWTDVSDAGASVAGRWTIIAPPASTGVTAPALPAAVSAWAPGSSASFGQVPTVVVVDADFVADYAALRAQAGSLPISKNVLNGRANAVAPPLPADGTLKLTAFTLSGD